MGFHCGMVHKSAHRKSYEAVSEDNAGSANDCGGKAMTARKDRRLIYVLINPELKQEDRESGMGIIQIKRVRLPAEQPGCKRVRILMPKEDDSMGRP